jgi:hypothetical protein
MNVPAQPLFREVQSFRVTRLRILLAIPPASMLLLLVWQVILGHPWGKHPMSNASIIGWEIFLWVVYLRLVTVRLVTEVHPHEISVAMRGFWRERHILLSEIKAVEVIGYDAARDWGGYGIRTTRRGKAYIAGANRGVRLKLVKGGMIVIGSERPEELVSAINRHALTSAVSEAQT